MNLDYFISSLPALLPEQPSAITLEEFRAACTEHLSGSLLAAVEALLDDQPSTHPFITAWRRHERGLRTAIARRCAARLGTDARPWIRPDGLDETETARGVAAAFEQPDPLQRERALDRIRWKAAEELQGIQPLTARVLLAYAIKLRLLARRQKLDAATGRQRLETLATLPAAGGGSQE